MTALKTNPFQRFGEYHWRKWLAFSILIAAIVLCMLVGGGTSKKGYKKGHKWPYSVCVNLKKDRPPAN